LEVADLNISFHTFAGEVQAIRGVDFDLYEGETLAIVGESGSGKSVTTKSIMRLLPPDNSEIKKGKILFKDTDLSQASEKKMQQIRGKEISMIFQDPMTSLNPTMTVGKQIIEPLLKHQHLSKDKAKKQALKLLDLVGIPKPEIRLKQYPHQFSGGMRQRVVIAIALACAPKVLIADEPTTALDVTIQGQILDLMKDLQKQIETSIIFITHDLGVVANVADRVAVMYGGKIVEVGTVDEIFYNPQHPYTWGLISSMPSLDTEDEELYVIPGTPPDLLHPPKGDAFAPRNPYAMKIDLEEEPPMFQVSDTHFAATWLLHPDAPEVDPPMAVKRRMAKFQSKQADSLKGGERFAELKTLLEVKSLKRHFNVGKQSEVRAVDDITFDIYKGETFGLVGESGCGKSTTGRTIIRLHDATDGEVLYKGESVHGKKSKSELQKFNRKMQMIFQDPYASLNPRMKVSDLIAEGIDIHRLTKSPKERMEKVYSLLETVGLNREHANRFPHEF